MDMPAAKPRLLILVRGRMRARHLIPRTVQAYVGWIVRYIRYHGIRHRTVLGDAEIIAHLTHLADQQRVSGSTHMQAIRAVSALSRGVGHAGR